MFANSQAGGTDNGGPDTCKTPTPGGPQPVPYPVNVAQGSMATGAAMKVLFDGTPAHNLGTSISMSNGDNAGTLGGVVSNRFLGQCRHTAGANTVLVAGKPVTRATSPTSQNNGNCVGVRSAPSQRKVLVTAG
jgi:Toxin PAAR-like domain